MSSQWAEPTTRVHRDQYEGRSGADEVTVDSKELVELTGATYRQIDYWCSQGYIVPVGDGNPGSGRRRRFNRSVVDRVKLVVRIATAFSRANSPLGAIFENYDEESIDLGNGIHLTWDIIEIERDTT